MPYQVNSTLPQHIRDVVPSSIGRNLWRAGFNGAQERGLSETAATAEGFAALKDNGYVRDPDTGLWEKESSMGKHADYRIVKQAPEQRYTLGVVYEPDTVDVQNDFASAATIRTAAHNFARALQGRQVLTKLTLSLLASVTKAIRGAEAIRLDVTDMVTEVEKAQARLGDMHEVWSEDLGEIVDFICLPCDATIEGEILKEGTWLLGIIHSPAQWELVKSGQRTGLSMGGSAKRRWREVVEEFARAS